MRPLVRVPRHPVTLARFGAPPVLPASPLPGGRRPEARALFGGVAAHAFRPLHRPMSSAIGLGHHRRRAPARMAGRRGRLAAITDALAAPLTDLGGKIETGTRSTRPSQLPPADVLMLDVAPPPSPASSATVCRAGSRAPTGGSGTGPGAFKVDFAIEGGVPWTNPSARPAGTVHLGGTFEESPPTERDIHAGRMPDRPFVLVGQQYLADPQRSAGNVHPLWTYAHVPHGYTGDATEAIIAQIERFAPGFRDRIVGTTVRSATQMAVYNPNYVGGDIMTGAKTSAN